MQICMPRYTPPFNSTFEMDNTTNIIELLLEVIYIIIMVAHI